MASVRIVVIILALLFARADCFSSPRLRAPGPEAGRGVTRRHRLVGQSKASANARKNSDEITLQQHLREELQRVYKRASDAERERDAARARVRELEQRLDLMTSGYLSEEEWNVVGNLKRIKNNLERSVKLFRQKTEKAEKARASEGGQLAYLAEGTTSSVRIMLDLVRSGALTETVLPAAVTSPLLVTHALGFYSRASDLEPHVKALIERVILTNHLHDVEPYMDEIMEQFDKIEPHLGYCLTHIDVLAPNCGPLLRHLDELLLYADESMEHSRYFPELLPFVSYFAPRLDKLAEKRHLTNLRPHLPKLVPHMAHLAPLTDRVVDYPEVSMNADVLVYYWGWALKTPGLRKIVQLWFFMPGTPRIVAWLATHLPKRPVRGLCSDIECEVTYSPDFTSGPWQPVSLRRGLRGVATRAKNWVTDKLFRSAL